ncbi:MAG: SusF/SusE family outer membrane protein [Paludibacter sp.]|nr:SusF/SusE family outer membrane protein [Paludibacter sp.]
MKNIKFPILLLMLFMTTIIHAADKLYIVGDAVFCGWDTNLVPLMYNNGNNVFTYTGWFDADKEFKFQTETNFESTSYRNAAGYTGYISNGSGTLVEKQGDTDDWKFKLTESGNYRITCDLNALTIVAQKLDYQATHVKYSALYLIGNSVPGGWNLNATTPVLWQDDNNYSVQVNLNASTNSGVDDVTFKFTTDPNRGWDTNYFYFRDISGAEKVSTDATDDRKWWVSETGKYVVNINLDDMSIHIRKYNVYSGTGNWSNTSNWTFGSVPASPDIAEVNSGELTVDQAANAYQVKILPGAKLTVSTGQSFTVSDSLLIESDDTGTGTFLDNGTSTIPSAKVQQYLTSGRSWYIAPPVSNAAYTNITDVDSVVFYDEPNAKWQKISSGNLTPGQGYIAVNSRVNAIRSFKGTLNNGEQTINLTRTAGKAKEGFNLIGNPYPSYVNWESTIKTNVGSTIWYRTKNTSGTYVFDTFNSGTGTDNNGSGAVTGLIPPMQAVWVRVAEGQTSGSVVFNNTMRSHATSSTTLLKAPKLVTNKILRLQVSNAVNSDEAIVVFNPESSDGFDRYDAEKMTNNNVAIPEIYTNPVTGSNNLVINSLENVNSVSELPLGFKTGETNNFTIKAKGLNYFDENTHIILKDNLLNAETDLTKGDAYSFASDAVNTSDRFTILFKVSSITTEENNPVDKDYLIYANGNLQIGIYNKTVVGGQTKVSVLNAVGQKISDRILDSTSTYITVPETGIYMVTVCSKGKTTVQKIIVK